MAVAAVPVSFAYRAAVLTWQQLHQPADLTSSILDQFGDTLSFYFFRSAKQALRPASIALLNKWLDDQHLVQRCVLLPPQGRDP